MLTFLSGHIRAVGFAALVYYGAYSLGWVISTPFATDTNAAWDLALVSASPPQNVAP
jgi:hypothetical protein